MIIRPAEEKDISKIARIGQIPEFEIASGGWIPPEAYKRMLSKDFFLVAEDCGKIAGFIAGEPMQISPLVMIWFFMVVENQRGKGTGKKLLDKFEQNCRKNGIKYIILYSPLENEDTKGFYLGRNFNEGKKFIEMTKALE